MTLTGVDRNAAAFRVVRSGHVVLRVSDVRRYQDFLLSAIGLKLVRDQRGMVYFSANPVSNHHMIAVAGGSPSFPPPAATERIGMSAIGYELVSMAAFERLYSRLASDDRFGITELSTDTHDSFASINFRDFDGNAFVFYHLAVPGEPASREARVPTEGGRELANATDRSGRPAPILDRGRQEIQGTGYLALSCRNVDASYGYFSNALGLCRSAALEAITGQTNAWLTPPGSPYRPILVLGQAASPDLPPPAPRQMYGMEHFSIEVGSFVELQAVYRHFVSTGIEISHTSDHGISMSIYLRDPDGNELEVYSDTPRALYRDPVDPFGNFGSITDELEGKVPTNP